MLAKRRIFYVLLLIILLFSSCTKKKQLTSDTPLEQLTKDENYEIHNPEDPAVLHVFDTAAMFMGNVGDVKVLLKFSVSNKTQLKGKFYVVDTASLLMRPHYFTLTTKGTDYHYQSDSKDFTFDMKYQANSNAFNGMTEVPQKSDAGIKSFSFRKYEDDTSMTVSQRYRKKIFEVQEILDLEYGRARGSWTSLPVEPGANYASVLLPYVFKTSNQKDLPLTMDLYLPQNDSLSNRPLVVLIHGGAFFFGDKHSPEMIAQCRHLASLGFVVASINYRMGFELSKISIQRCAFKSIQDAHAAMRFLVHYADKYGIDKSRLYIGGSSAGSITAMNMVYMTDDNKPKTTKKKHFAQVHGNLHSAGNEFHDAFEIRGLINMWGALYEIDDFKKFPVSIVSFHGTEDKVVPYAQGYPFAQLNGKNGKGKLSGMYFDEMYGSKAIHDALKNSSVHHEFYPIDSVGHAPWKNDDDGALNEVYYFIQQKMSKFLYDDLVYDVKLTRKDKTHYCLAVNELKSSHWRVEGGVVVSKHNGEADIRLFADAPKYSVTVSGSLNNEAGFLLKKSLVK